MNNQTETDHSWFYAEPGTEPEDNEATAHLDVEAERTIVSTEQRPRPRAGWSQVGRELGYLIPNLPITIAGFVVMITGFSVGLGLVPLFLVGLPILVATLFAARGMATFERGRLGLLLGHPVGPVHYRPAGPGRWGRIFGFLRDPQLWKDWGFFIVSFPIRLATWSIAITWVVGSFGGLTYLLWEWSLPRGEDNKGLAELIGWPGRAADIVFNTAVGLVMALLLPWVLRVLTSTEAAVAVTMLTNENTVLRARTDELSRSRQAVVRAEADTLRRVERDIHDGPQQRLVRLTMDLEAVQRRIADDPAAASEIVDSALVQTKEALTELRALSRGIAPPILTDRGLHAALVAAAARCPIPTVVNFDAEVATRLPAAVENAAYFVVTEALTNVAKHSAAHQCVVAVQQFGSAGAAGAQLQLRISDDGQGGAATGKGHGLAGLVDRLAGVDGRLTVDSPDGLGTVIAADIPLPTDNSGNR